MTKPRQQSTKSRTQGIDPIWKQVCSSVSVGPIEFLDEKGGKINKTIAFVDLLPSSCFTQCCNSYNYSRQR